MESLQTARENFIESLRPAFLDIEETVHRDRLDILMETTLAEILVEQYKDWVPAPRSSHQSVHVFAPSLLSMRAGPSASMRTSEVETPHEVIDRWISGILHLSLYVDRVWVADPVEILAWQALTAEMQFTLTIHRPIIANKIQLLHALKAFEELKPLMDAKIVCLYPAMTCYQGRTAAELFGEVRSFTRTEMDNAWPELYIAEGLSYARIFDASYTALFGDEYTALTHAASKLDSALGLVDRKVLATLPQIKLPSFRFLDAANLMSVRSNEASFNDFRKFMREITAKLAGGLEDPAFFDEVRTFEKDELQPALENLRKDLLGTNILKERLTDVGMDFSAGAFAGISVTGNVLAGILAGTASALTKALVKTIVKSVPVRSASSVVFKFETGKTVFPGLKGSTSAWITVMSHSLWDKIDERQTDWRL
ncbi:hypothetical protein [Acidicapsa acidisoli]|uniref:hypothetical protein n=1 Tax=Acidicapsa acidisoli TaxID=1615681 RepID=UPI0021DFB7FC|nr:hypothetical protein [Acidicapsa acidisoli]